MYCKETFKSNARKQYHIIRFHTCRLCAFQGKAMDLEAHYTSHSTHRQIGQGRRNIQSTTAFDTGPFTVTQDFDGDTVIYDHSDVSFPLFEQYFITIEKYVENIFRKSIGEMGMFKVTPHLAVTFARKIADEEPESFSSFELGELQIIYHPDRIKASITKIKQSLESQINLFETNGSGYVLKSVNGLQLRIGVYKQTRGGCYIPTPLVIKKTRSVVNIKSNNDQCFKWSVISSLHKVSNNSSRRSSYVKYVDNYDFSMLTCPVFVNDVKIFEKHNVGIGVNIFSYKIRSTTGKHRVELLPEYISNLNYVQGVKIANLLLLENQNHSHYVGIKDISKLIGENGYRKQLICYNCMCRFSKVNYSKHLEDCRKNQQQKVRMPSSIPFEKPTLKFSNFQNTLKQGFVAYSDWESILRPVGGVKLAKKKMKV